MMPNRLSPESCVCGEVFDDDVEAAPEGEIDAVDVRTGLASSVVDAIAEEGLGDAEVESEVSVESVDGMV